MATPRAAQHRDLEQRLRNIEAGLRQAITRGLRRPKFEVSDGDLMINGGDLIVDGGDFLLLDTDGSTVFRLGPQVNGDRGVSIYRENGAAAVVSAKRFAGSTDQSIAVYGRGGQALMVEEELGDGLAAPWFPIPMQPQPAASGAVQAGPHGFELPVTAGTFTTTHFAEFPRQDQYLRFKIAVQASDATTAGEVQVINVANGNALGGFLSAGWLGTLPAGGTGYVITEPPRLFAPGSYGSLQRIAVQVRRTAGTGTLTVAVPYSHGSSG